MLFVEFFMIFLIFVFLTSLNLIYRIMLYFGSLSSNILVSDCLQRHQEAISARWPAVYIHFLSTNRHHHHQSHHHHPHHHDHHCHLYNHHHFTHFHTDHHHIFFCSYLIYKQIILRHRLVQVGLRGVLLVHRGSSSFLKVTIFWDTL